MTRLSETASGVFVISVTPFTERGDLDLDSTDRVVDFYLEKGANGLTVLGMMGEAPKLTAGEAQTFVRRVVPRMDGKPLVVGVSAPGLAAMRSLAHDVMSMGAAGVMVAPPASLKTGEQIADYYALVAETLGPDVPVVVQDFPLATNVHFSVATLLTIIRSVPSVVMLKHEDWPGLAKISSLRRQHGDRRISILVGNGGLFLPEELERGADGAMTGFAFPEMMVDVCRFHLSGERDRARDVFDAYLPLARYEQQPGLGLAVRKFVLAERGAIATPTLRKPGPSLNQAFIDEIRLLMSRQERRLAMVRP